VSAVEENSVQCGKLLQIRGWVELKAWLMNDVLSVGWTAGG